MSWQVQVDGKSKTFTEEKLRKKLRGGDISGVELCLPPGEQSWRPLHGTDLFRQEVPHTGDAATAARMRAIKGFGWHAAIFLGVMIFMGFPFWGIFWGIAVGGHLMGTLPVMLALLKNEDAPQVASAVEADPYALDPDDPFAVRLRTLLADLGEGVELEDVAGAARRIHVQRVQLDAAISASSVPKLVAEREVAESDDERASIDAHIEAVQAAIVSRDRLLSQERELMRSLERLQLARLQSADGDLTEQLTSLRQRLDAESEVERRLAAARQASRQRQR